MEKTQRAKAKLYSRYGKEIKVSTQIEVYNIVLVNINNY